MKKRQKQSSEKNKAWNRIKNKKPLLWIIYMFFGFLLLCFSLFVSWGVQLILDHCVPGFFPEGMNEPFRLAEAIVAAFAAGFVLFQLGADTNAEEKQASVDKAQFITEFNRAFIENEKLNGIESYLESSLTGAPLGDMKDLSERRSDLVNYLVYLEGFSACILQGILDIEDIDDLFSYRFFLALNHPEVQSQELCFYATYYRGCFKLYDKWLEYRMATPKYNAEGIENWDIPLFETALCFWRDYEKYTDSQIETVKGDVLKNGKKRAKIIIDKNNKRITVDSFKKEKTLHNRKKIIRSMIYGSVPEELLNDNTELEIDASKCGHVCKTELQEELRNIRSYNRHRGVYERGFRFFQLRKGQNLTTDNLKSIAELIYRTDGYIYPDMFGNENEAIRIIPMLLCSGNDRMFNLDNIYVCESSGEILGLVLWKTGPLNWSSQALLSEMSKMPPRFKDVEDEYVKGYEETKEKTISILNFCVSDKCRKKGIGTALFNRFVASHSNSDLELCVLEENESAIKLYRSAGFEQQGEHVQAYPRTEKNHWRINMIRKKQMR